VQGISESFMVSEKKVSGLTANLPVPNNTYEQVAGDSQQNCALGNHDTLATAFW
jgi:hypothetical protein